MPDISGALTSPLVLLAGGAAFFLVIGVWLAVTTLFYMRRVRSEERLHERLQPNQKHEAKTKTLRLWREGRVGTTTVLDHVTPGPVTKWLLRVQHGLGWGAPLPTLALALVAGMFLVFVIVFLVSQNALLALLSVVVVPMAMNFYAGFRANREAAVFERQLADALGLASRSLRAGHPLMSAFQLIVDELEPPVSNVFAEICQQQQLGKSLEEAIRSTANKSQSDDLKLFASSTIIQLRSGGNLADMMERLVAVIRDRIRLQRRVRILTAQTQFSKRVLIFMPFFLILVLLVLKPGYLDPMLTTDIGRYMLGIAGIFLLFGSWFMNRIATLRY